MRRAIAFVVLIALIAGVAWSLAWWGDPGRASLQWFGWRIDATAATLAGALAIAAVLLSALVTGIAWLAGLPRRRRRRQARRAAVDALARGFAAVRSGEPGEARRQADRALGEGVAEDLLPLARLLRAQADAMAPPHEQKPDDEAPLTLAPRDERRRWRARI